MDEAIAIQLRRSSGHRIELDLNQEFAVPIFQIFLVLTLSLFHLVPAKAVSLVTHSILNKLHLGNPAELYHLLA